MTGFFRIQNYERGTQVDNSKQVEIDGLTFEYIRRDENGNVEAINTAIDNINLSIEKGQFIAVLGRNGSGKSTFARHLNALLSPTSGEVLIDGYNTKDQEMLADIRKRCQMVFQNPDNQIIGSIVEEDVGFGPENLCVPTSKIWDRVYFGLNAVGMIKYAKRSPNRLSGGQKQRVAIAGTLAMEPEVIVLDEPTAMLDPAGRKEVIEAVTKLNKEQNVTIILITHFLDEIINADKVFVMDKGKIVMSGSVNEIFDRPDELEEIGIELPQAVLLAKKLRNASLIGDERVKTSEELAAVLEKYYR